MVMVNRLGDNYRILVTARSGNIRIQRAQATIVSRVALKEGIPVIPDGGTLASVVMYPGPEIDKNGTCNLTVDARPENEVVFEIITGQEANSPSGNLVQFWLSRGVVVGKLETGEAFSKPMSKRPIVDTQPLSK